MEECWKTLSPNREGGSLGMAKRVKNTNTKNAAELVICFVFGSELLT